MLLTKQKILASITAKLIIVINPSPIADAVINSF